MSEGRDIKHDGPKTRAIMKRSMNDGFWFVPLYRTPAGHKYLAKMCRMLVAASQYKFVTPSSLPAEIICDSWRFFPNLKRGYNEKEFQIEQHRTISAHKIQRGSFMVDSESRNEYLTLGEKRPADAWRMTYFNLQLACLNRLVCI